MRISIGINKLSHLRRQLKPLDHVRGCLRPILSSCRASHEDILNPEIAMMFRPNGCELPVLAD